ncbi:catalase-like [Diabrotica virgifera virgifera]|uniref:Catalase n=1 Tax=Diabrotica virgifera virgifera TaxID=50390 RepID=A0A6P7FWP5_DIAVI|nr:catalase-like [Diabrotica virgifera virgifera]
MASYSDKTTSTNRDAAAEQLTEWHKNNKEHIGYSTNGAGIALINKDCSLTAGKYGPIILTDYELCEQLQKFNRERIPERVVHAKGAGAFGYFECTKALTDLTVSKVFESVGKKTPIAVRFSQVAGNLGSADTVRDPRGFALKFYTEEGNWDVVGNNTPIFFMRDPILFPMFIHSQKRNPVTNLRDWDAFWDYLGRRPESVHQVLFLFSDRGIPDGHRHQHGYGSHTFSMIGKNRKLTWVKYIYKTNQGIKNLDPATADKLAGTDPDYAVRDLYNAIEAGKKTGKYPSWTFYIQTMTPEQATKVKFNPFDITKVWPHQDFPLIKVGTFTLNRNPGNWFSELEQLAFAPSNLTPGFGGSPDRLLQGRLFGYPDAHLHRLGTNFEQLPVNRPIKKIENFERDGPACLYNQGGAPNYHPNSFGGPEVDPAAKNWTQPPEHISGDIDYHDLSNDDNYSQPNVFWNKVLDEAAKGRLVNNLAGAIKNAKKEIQDRAVEVFKNVDPVLGERLIKTLAQVKVNL